MTDLAPVTTPQPIPVPSTWEAAWRLAQRIANTPFVPGALRGKPESVLAAILFGDELGIGPMQALSQIHVIDGRPAASPELMRALVARAGHRIDVVELGDEQAVLIGTRADTGGTATITWSMDDARRANLAGKGSWRSYPRAMLLARATSELCRALFPDVVSGLSYTPEEVASIDNGSTWEASTTPTPDTATSSVYPDPTDLFDRVKATAGTPIAERLKALAEHAGRKLTARDFADHPAWADVIDQALEQLSARADADTASATTDQPGPDPIDEPFDDDEMVDGIVLDAEFIDDPEADDA